MGDEKGKYHMDSKGNIIYTPSKEEIQKVKEEREGILLLIKNLVDKFGNAAAKLGYQKPGPVDGYSADIVMVMNLKRLESSDLGERLYGLSHIISLDTLKVQKKVISDEYSDIGTQAEDVLKELNFVNYPVELKELAEKTIIGLREAHKAGKLPLGLNMEHYLDNHHREVFGAYISGGLEEKVEV